MPIVGNAEQPLAGQEIGLGKAMFLVNNVTTWSILGGDFQTQDVPAESALNAPQWGQVLAGNNAGWHNVTASHQ